MADSILIRFWFHFITHKRHTCMSRLDTTGYERAEWHTRAHSVHSLVETGETGALWGRWRDEWRRRWMSLRHHQRGKCAACATSRRSLFKQTWRKFPCVFYGGLSFCKSLPFITVFCLDGRHFPLCIVNTHQQRGRWLHDKLKRPRPLKNCLMFLHFDVWPSVCRMMNVQFV